MMIKKLAVVPSRSLRTPPALAALAALATLVVFASPAAAQSRPSRAVATSAEEATKRQAPGAGADTSHAEASPRGTAEAPASEAPETESESGFSIGARVGYALPMGSIAKDASLQGATDLAKTAAGMLPLWADMGYRIDRHWYVGGYFQLGIVSTAGDLCKRVGGGNPCTSSGTDLRFGGLVRYTFKPDAKLSPWVGASSGYEIVDVGVTVGQSNADFSAKGWEFIGLHFGADFHPAPNVSMGPLVMASFGQYASQSWSQPNASGSSDFTNTSLHQWVFLGFRGQYDL